jgi:tetratricopeptide (TPR) repeat protein
MAPIASWRRGSALALLGAWLALAGACTSQQEVALSALHYFDRGNAAYTAEDYKRAIDDYRTALQFDDQSPDVYYNLGLAYYRVGAYTDAVDAYQHAVKLDPAFADAHLNLALAYDKLYNSAAANLHYNRYRALVTGKKEPEAPVAALPVDAVQSSTSFQPVSALPGVGEAEAKRQAQFQRVGPANDAPPGGAASGGTAPISAGPESRGRSPQPATSLLVPQGARPGTMPPAESLQQAEQPAPPNPFKGNPKWWTQDAAIQNR